MTKYLQGSWTQSTSTEGTTDYDWERNFGPPKRQRCSARCGGNVFTKVKDRKALTTAYAEHKGEQWVCKRCGAPVEDVSRVVLAIEQERDLEALMDQIQVKQPDGSLKPLRKDIP